ncbi:MAG: hypothetical protein NC230_09300 [Bacteroides sp.]|nr:hypothetical protein [Bacteroides sp.]
MTFLPLRHIIMATLAFALAVSPGCSSIDDESPVIPVSKEEREATDMSLRLKVAINYGGTPSRAAADKVDEYEPIPDNDFEKVKTLRVFLLGPDGKFLRANRMVRLDENLNPIGDNLTFRVMSNEVLYVYLIANESSLTLPQYLEGYNSVTDWLDSFHPYDDNSGVKDLLEGWTTGFDSDKVSGTIGEGAVANGSLFFKGADPHLPMTESFRLRTKSRAELTNVSTSTQVEEYLQEAKLFITPAAAKATFRFDLSDYTGSGYDITAIRLSGFDTREYVMPRAEYSPAKYTGAEEKGDINSVSRDNCYITSFQSPSNGQTATFELDLAQGSQTIPLEQTTGPISRGDIYFPESLSRVATGAYKVSLQLSDGTWLPEQPLATNLLMIAGAEAISRSTHLYIDIKFAQKSFTATATLFPYTGVDLNPKFGF